MTIETYQSIIFTTIKDFPFLNPPNPNSQGSVENEVGYVRTKSVGFCFIPP